MITLSTDSVVFQTTLNNYLGTLALRQVAPGAQLRA
jgi:hypothetical protein